MQGRCALLLAQVLHSKGVQGLSWNNLIALVQSSIRLFSSLLFPLDGERNVCVCETAKGKKKSETVGRKKKRA